MPRSLAAGQFIRAEGFNTPPLGAVKKVLNPECNSTGERTIPRCLRRGSFILQKFLPPHFARVGLPASVCGLSKSRIPKFAKKAGRSYPRFSLGAALARAFAHAP